MALVESKESVIRLLASILDRDQSFGLFVRVNSTICCTIQVTIVTIASAFLRVDTAVRAAAKCASHFILNVCLNQFRRSYTFI